jgi:hypothetical protein
MWALEYNPKLHTILGTKQTYPRIVYSFGMNSSIHTDMTKDSMGHSSAPTAST